jgi:hypothetical protein
MAEDTINQLAYNLATLAEWAMGGAPTGSLVGHLWASAWRKIIAQPQHGR